MNPHLLVVIAPGFGLEDALLTDTPLLHGLAASDSVVERLHRHGEGQPFDDGLVAELRALSLDVDRRSLVLRPPWRGDDAVLAELEHRPAGPADLTLLELRDVARAAAAHGPGSAGHRRALRRLEDHLRAALGALLRDGSPPELWLVATGPLRPVARTVDPLALLAGVRGLRRVVERARCTPTLLTLAPERGTELAALQAALQGGPLARHGTIVTAAAALALGLPPALGRVRFAAADGVAFARQPVRAVRPWLPRAPLEAGFAFVPGLRGRRHDLDDFALAARLLARAAALTAAPALGPALADLEPVVEHDRLHVVEH